MPTPREKGVTVGLVLSSSEFPGGVEAHVLTLMRHSGPSPYEFVAFAPRSFVRSAGAIGLQAEVWSARSASDILAARRLKALVKKAGIHLLHLQDPRAGMLGRLVARLVRIPAVCTVHVPSYRYVAGVGTALKRRVYQTVEGFLDRHWTDREIYVSRRAFEEAVALRVASPARSVVIPNGVELDQRGAATDREAARAHVGVPNDVVVVTFVGRLTHQKGVDVLLDAAELLRTSARKIQVWILGEGPLRPRLEHRATHDGLSTVVRFLGMRADVLRLLRASDVFVLPSRYEGMPFALLEAMAAGLPSVVSRVGGNEELVEDGTTGWLVQPEDAGALARHLSLLIDDPELRTTMGRAARDRVQHFSADRMVSRVFEVYNDVLRERARDSRR